MSSRHLVSNRHLSRLFYSPVHHHHLTTLVDKPVSYQASLARLGSHPPTHLVPLTCCLVILHREVQF